MSKGVTHKGHTITTHIEHRGRKQTLYTAAIDGRFLGGDNYGYSLFYTRHLAREEARRRIDAGLADKGSADD